MAKLEKFLAEQAGSGSDSDEGSSDLENDESAVLRDLEAENVVGAVEEEEVDEKWLNKYPQEEASDNESKSDVISFTIDLREREVKDIPVTVDRESKLSPILDELKSTVGGRYLQGHVRNRSRFSKT
jgi:hypothetical protein